MEDGREDMAWVGKITFAEREGVTLWDDFAWTGNPELSAYFNGHRDYNGERSTAADGYPGNTEAIRAHKYAIAIDPTAKLELDVTSDDLTEDANPDIIY